MNIYFTIIVFVRTQFESLAQRINEPEKAQYNELLESGLENWALMNQTTSKVNSDDKKMKINWFNLKKIVLSTVRGD